MDVLQFKYLITHTDKGKKSIGQNILEKLMCACDRSIAAIPPRAVAAHGPCDVVGRATYGNTYGAAHTQTSQ